MDRNGADGIPDVLVDTSIDERVFRALSERPRRYALYVLLDRESIGTSELADVLTGWLYAAGRGMAGPEEHERVRRDLHHVHLPMLVDAGLVECDEAYTVVELSALRVRILELLQWSRAYERETSRDVRSTTDYRSGEV